MNAPIRKRRKEDRPTQLIEAAIELFTQRGYNATRAEEIAKRAGVSKGTLFLYFSSKEALFEAAVKQSILPILLDAQGLVSEFHGSATQLLRALVQRWWQGYGQTSSRTLPILIMTDAHNFPHCAAYYAEEVLLPTRALVYQTIERGIAQGEFASTLNVSVAWLSFHALLTYPAVWEKSVAISREALDADTLTLDDYIQQHLELLLRGLAASPQA